MRGHTHRIFGHLLCVAMPGMVNGVRGFSVAHLNIRSIKSKINELTLVLRNTAYDVLTISETWLHSRIDSSIIAINGYNMIRQDRENLVKTGLIQKKGED